MNLNFLNFISLEISFSNLSIKVDFLLVCIKEWKVTLQVNKFISSMICISLEKLTSHTNNGLEINRPRIFSRCIEKNLPKNSFSKFIRNLKTWKKCFIRSGIPKISMFWSALSCPSPHLCPTPPLFLSTSSPTAASKISLNCPQEPSPPAASERTRPSTNQKLPSRKK